jgi:hypothetical protein
MTTRIKLRRDTAANWISNDPVLALGEAGYDTTNNELRVGDGTTAWSGLETIGGGISSNIAIAPEFGPEVRFARPEDVATDAVNAVDVIDTGVALGRNSEWGGLLNTLEDSLDGYGGGSGQSYVGQPTHTEWNTDGWADLSDVTTRVYDDFKDMRQYLGDDGFLATQLVMHDTLNDKYYTFKFDRWSVGDNGGDGGYSYVRRLINHTQYFTKTNYGNELDSIDTGLVITRGNNGGIYNDESEVDHNSDVSPQGTEWNIDGWSDLSNLLTRTYTNFTSAFSYQVGQRILGKEAIMHDTINDKYYAVKFLQWTQNNNGGGFTWQRRLIDTTQLDEGVHFGDGTVQTTAGVTFNSDGSLELPGGLVLPTQTNKGYNVFNTLTGPTLRLSNDSQNQVIVTGPAATENNTYAQRIVIQGQRGYGSTSTQGEGGDVYIWGGIGGETNGNTEGWNPGGGSGGDIKLRGGEGLNDTGGYVRIEGGNVAHFSTSTTGNAGFVEINGGDVVEDNNAVSSLAGNVTITGGRAYSASTQSGIVQIITGGTRNPDVVGANTWEFGNDGTLTLPSDGIIQSVDNNGRLRSQLRLDEGSDITRLSGWSSPDSQSFTTSDWTTGTYTNNAGAGVIEFTGAETIISWLNANNYADRFFFTVNGGPQMESTGWGGGVSDITFNVATPPETSPTTVTSFSIYYQFESRLDIDTDDQEFYILSTNNNLYLQTRQAGNIQLNSVEDLDLVGNGIVNLRNNSTSTGIQIRTDDGDHIWNFGVDGTLTFPDSTVQTTAYIDNRTTGSWTLATGANTVSITVPLNSNYQMWVNGNIPNGIVEWNATVNVSNPNVPAIGSQHAWYYYDGNALVLTAIPDQIVGTTGVISTASNYAGTASNVFTFGITNNSTSTQVVTWGYTTL